MGKTLTERKVIYEHFCLDNLSKNINGFFIGNKVILQRTETNI